MTASDNPIYSSSKIYQTLKHHLLWMWLYLSQFFNWQLHASHCMWLMTEISAVLHDHCSCSSHFNTAFCSKIYFVNLAAINYNSDLNMSKNRILNDLILDNFGQVIMSIITRIRFSNIYKIVVWLMKHNKKEGNDAKSPSFVV